jgi:hypothetical protein
MAATTTARGEPIRVDGSAPDGRWFGAVPESEVSVDGKEAEKLIPKIRSVIENYRFWAYGDYSSSVIWHFTRVMCFLLVHKNAVSPLKEFVVSTLCWRICLACVCFPSIA